jgi:hypothetical protein
MAKIMHAEMEKKGKKIKTLSFLFPLFRDMNSVSVAKDTYQKFPNNYVPNLVRRPIAMLRCTYRTTSTILSAYLSLPSPMRCVSYGLHSS